MYVFLETGRILYRLRGHDKSVIALSWCPSPFSVFKDDKHTVEKNEKTETSKFVANILTNIVDSIFSWDTENVQKSVTAASDKENLTKDDTVSESSSTPAKKKLNPWINLKHADDDEIPSTHSEHNPQNGSLAEDTAAVSESTTSAKKKVNPWINLKHVDDDEIVSNHTEQKAQNREVIEDDSNDFLKACAALKQQIIASKEEADEVVTLDRDTSSSSNRSKSIVKVSEENCKEVVDSKCEGFIETIEESSCDNEVAEMNNGVPEKCCKVVTDNQSKKCEEVTQMTSEDNGCGNEYSKQFLLASSARGG